MLVYLDPITYEYVELISKSRLFSLCIYYSSASRMSNYFMSTLWLYRPSLLVHKYIFMMEKRKTMKDAAPSVSQLTKIITGH